MIRQEIIRDNNFNIIEEFDNCGNHIKYDSNGDISYCRRENFEYPLIINSVSSLKEKEFIDVIKDGIIKIDEIEYPNCIFFIKNGNCIFEYDFKNGHISFNYELIWSVLQRKYSINDKKIEVFLKDMMERHFNCRDVKPTWLLGAFL